MLQEESDTVLQGLVSSINDIEQGHHLPPPFDEVQIGEPVQHYVPAIVNDSPPKKLRLRLALSAIGVMMLFGALALVGMMVWNPSYQPTMKHQDAGVTTTIEIEVWDGDLPPSCFEDPTQSHCVPDDSPDDLMGNTLDAIRKEGEGVDPLSPEELHKRLEENRSQFVGSPSIEKIQKHFEGGAK